MDLGFDHTTRRPWVGVPSVDWIWWRFRLWNLWTALHFLFGVYTTYRGWNLGRHVMAGVPKGEANYRRVTFKRIVAIICSGIFGVLLLAVLILTVMVAGRE